MANELTTPEAAARLGVTGAHVRRLCAEGVLRSRKPSERVLLISAASVERYAKGERKRGPKPKAPAEVARYTPQPAGWRKGRARKLHADTTTRGENDVRS